MVSFMVGINCGKMKEPMHPIAHKLHISEENAELNKNCEGRRPLFKGISVLEFMEERLSVCEQHIDN